MRAEVAFGVAEGVRGSATIESIAAIEASLIEENYVADRSLATTIFLGERLGKPILLEGEAGVGKTEVAKVLARVHGTRLIRLQCYEGLDAGHAIYEWNYQKQLLRIKLAELGKESAREVEDSVFSEQYLIKRPLLEAVTHSAEDEPPVLLIDELDRAEEEFEAFLLEILSEFQITIPELGTFKAPRPPRVIITSNRTRELHDALKRRCLYLWIPYPDLDKEIEIVRRKVPDLNRNLVHQLCQFVQALRREDVYKRPGVAESLDWAGALLCLGADHLTEELVRSTLGCILKYREDVQRFGDADLRKFIDVAHQGETGGTD